MAEVVSQLALVLLVLRQEELAEGSQLRDSTLMTTLKLGGCSRQQRAALSASASLFLFHHVGSASSIVTFQLADHAVDPCLMTAFLVGSSAPGSAAEGISTGGVVAIG